MKSKKPPPAGRAAKRSGRRLRRLLRRARRRIGMRAIVRAIRAAVNAIPGKPHRHLRPLYMPLVSVVFRRQKG